MIWTIIWTVGLVLAEVFYLLSKRKQKHEKEGEEDESWQ